jgi:polyphosphate kinase
LLFVLFRSPDLFQGFFEFDQICAFSLKLTRDAEYNISDTLDQSLIDKMSKGIRQRLKSEPTRLVYDAAMPEQMLKVLTKQLGTGSMDALIAGSRYRNFKDFIGFPNLGHQSMEFPPLPPLPSPDFEAHPTTFDAIRNADIMLYYPYHSFGYFTEWVRQASRVARREEPRYDVEQKLSVLREASRYSYPSGDIEEILADIERGRFSSGESS